MLSIHRLSRPPRSKAVRIRNAVAAAIGLCLLAPALAASASSSSGAAEDLQSAGGRTWYVATTGSGTAPGTKAQPLRRLAQAVNRAGQGDRIVLRKGTYHERVVVTTPDVTIMAMPGEAVWMDGSSSVTGFRATGATWTRANWNYNFDHSPTFTRGAPDNQAPNWGFVNPAYPMAAHPDQVWVSGKRLRQVKTPADVRPGTFAVDTRANKLVVGTKPFGKTVRASTLTKAIAVRATGVRLIGFGIRRYAGSLPDLGAVTLEKPNLRMIKMKVVSNATVGVGAYADDVHLVDSTFSRNGLIGVHGSQAYGLRMRGLTVKRNNLEHFNEVPSAGGIKVGRSRDVSLSDSVVSQNFGTGIWYDESVYHSRVINNRLTGNTEHGVHLELSERSIVANNLILNNVDKGIQVVDTGNVQIYNNTLVNNDRPLNIIQDRRTPENPMGSGHDPRRPWPDPTVPWRTANVTIRNNVIAYPREAANCLLCVEDAASQRSAAQMGVAPESNVYVRADRLPTWLVVWSRGAGNPEVFTTLAAFRRATGHERFGVHTSRAVVSSRGKASDELVRWGEKRASALPADIAERIGVRTSLRRIGAIPWRLNW